MTKSSKDDIIFCQGKIMGACQSGPQKGKYFSNVNQQLKQTIKNNKSKDQNIQPTQNGPQYLSNQAKLINPYDAPSPKIGPELYNENRKRVVINKGQEKSINFINSQATLAHARRQCEISDRLKFLMPIGSKSYMVQQISQKKIKVSKIWQKINGYYHISMQKYDEVSWEPVIPSEQQKQLKQYYTEYLQKSKKSSLLILIRNYRSSVLCINQSISLSAVRAVLSVDPEQQFYEVDKKGSQLPISKISEQNLTVKQVKGKDKDGNQVLRLKISKGVKQWADIIKQRERKKKVREKGYKKNELALI